MAMNGNAVLNDSVVVKFPIAAKRVREVPSFEREILIRIKIAEQNLMKELDRHVANKLAKNIEEAISFYNVSCVEELSNFHKRIIVCSKKRTESFQKNIEEILKSLVFVSPREVIYRKVPYTRYEEVKNLTLNHLEALDEHMRDFEYDPTLIQAYDVYVNDVKAFLKLVKFL